MSSQIHTSRRNPGHWDIYDASKRVFAICGGAQDKDPDYWVRDERADQHKVIGPFPSAELAVSWGISTLMKIAEEMS